MTANPDAIIEVRFKTSEEGGRKSDVSGTVYSCPLFVNGEGFDCRISLENKTVQLGQTYELPVNFLVRERAVPRLSIGVHITLWEGKNVAEGRVLKIFS